ncbi:MAG: hypothetical protein GDA38_25230 [Hormoscilla sp. SP12CHS1]|nr:hypothetical protein [Hormoscilla sp. SP12CHS1]
MKKVELHELQEQMLLAGKAGLEVQQNGKLLGYFYPVLQQDKAEVDALWERWEKVLDRVMAETGLDEEGLVEALAPKKTKKHEVSA